MTKTDREALVEIARMARKWAYAPYSKYSVGAAILTTSGKIYEGVNIENAAYPSTICAERVAAFKAISEGEKEFQAIAVVTENGGSPCGTCRQVLSEFGSNIEVLIADRNGAIIHETHIAELLPDAFGPDFLKNIG